MNYSFKSTYNHPTLFLENVTPSLMADYIFPQDMEDLNIRDDYLETLTIPNGVKCAVVSYLGLRELYVPDSMEMLYCSNNKLKKLELPENILIVHVEDNLLQELTFRGDPKELLELDVSNNRLETLSFIPPKSLHKLVVKYTPLRRLSLAFQRIIFASDDDTF